ncbi:type II toxin-antitoxin system Phd/YefM family antitoxin [Olsenella sp. SW781]|uniref:type II toxin-antitoxin system Phd/YefM family antitoxin n=1 Tax=Olsenella sp. SW781 TaxID=2530046 RepID=UPI00143BDAF2|nr:type II toxin-antitoxin system Phd/YefM family antitoxin [Olsenella sp. SW781]
MQSVRPVSDLRNKFVEISEDVHESGRPAILTRNGCDDMVVTSTESFEELSFHSEVLVALRETEREAAITQRFSLSTRFSRKPVRLSRGLRLWNLAVYRVEVLPSTRGDVVDAARCMAQALGNPQAAESFLDQFEEGFVALLDVALS